MKDGDKVVIASRKYCEYGAILARYSQLSGIPMTCAERALCSLKNWVAVSPVTASH